MSLEKDDYIFTFFLINNNTTFNISQAAIRTLSLLNNSGICQITVNYNNNNFN